MGTLTLFGAVENKLETLGFGKKWVGRIVDIEREKEAIAKGGTVVSLEGTMDSEFCSSVDLVSGFSLWRLGSI